MALDLTTPDALIANTGGEKYTRAPQPLRSGILSSAEFIAAYDPPDPLISGIVNRGYVYSNTGSTGSGKTAVALRITAHVARGLPLAGHEVEQGRVLFLAGENPQDVHDRWLALAEHMKFDPAAIDVHFRPGVFKIADLTEAITRDVAALGGVALVVVDTSAAYFVGDEENSNVQMGAHARQLRSLVNLPGGPCVLVNCHPTKNASSDNLLPRGGGAFLAEVDGNLTCIKSEEGVRLHWQGKFRGPEFNPIPFELRTVTADRVRNSKGNLTATVIAAPLSEAELTVRTADARSDVDAALILLLKNTNNGGVGLRQVEIADALNWRNKDGKVNRPKASRIAAKLKRAKLVQVTEAGTNEEKMMLTSKGRKQAEQTAYNAKAAGGRYGC